MAHFWNWDRHHDGSDIHHRMGDVRMTSVETEPNKCPTCESDDISYTGTFEDGCMKVECQICPSSWWEVWQFHYIEMIEGEDNRGEEE